MTASWLFILVRPAADPHVVVRRHGGVVHAATGAVALELDELDVAACVAGVTDGALTQRLHRRHRSRQQRVETRALVGDRTERDRVEVRQLVAGFVRAPVVGVALDDGLVVDVTRLHDERTGTDRVDAVAGAVGRGRRRIERHAERGADERRGERRVRLAQRVLHGEVVDRCRRLSASPKRSQLNPGRPPAGAGTCRRWSAR